MITAAKTTSKMLVPITDRIGGRRRARRRLLRGVGAVAAGTAAAAVLAVVQRQRRAGSAARPSEAAHRPSYEPQPMGSPLDDLATRAERMKVGAADEPGHSGHLGFGVGGSIPSESRAARATAPAPTETTGGDGLPVSGGDGLPTGGGDALGAPIRARGPLSAEDGIVTGAGEGISNSSMPSPNGTAHHTLH